MNACEETCLRKNLYLRFFLARNMQVDDDLDNCIIYSLTPNDWEIELDDKYILSIGHDAIYLYKGRKYKLIPGTSSLFLYVVKGFCQ